MHPHPSASSTARGPWWLVSLLALALAACGPEGALPEPGSAPAPGSVATRESSLGEARVRLMAANITSGNQQSYDPGHGTRIFQGLKPDIVMIQEFNIGSNTDAAVRAYVDSTFGPEFYYYRETGAQIPNGIISRYPILESGEWTDTQVGNRDFAWARIDVPGPTDLWVVSVHLLTRSEGVRNTEAGNLVNYIKGKVPAGAFLAIGGDFNTDNRSESCFPTFSAVVSTAAPYPADKNGNGGTNASRSKPYDHVLVSSNLRTYQTATVVGSSSFSAGLVVDTRVYSPLAEIAPAQSGDSGATNMQHMAVVKDFLLPTDGVEPGSVRVTAPNGGESWTVNSTHALTWMASNVANVKLEYTLDGSTWTQIIASTPASPGTYSWTVPNSATSSARVRVSDAANAAVSDTSDAAFSIVVAPPSGGSAITQETESNDAMATASGRVGAGTPVSGAVASATDVDWFRFTATAAGPVQVRLTLASASYLTWYLHAEGNPRTSLARGTVGSNPQTATYDVPAAGTYYVKVVGYSGGTGGYSLAVNGAGVQP